MILILEHFPQGGKENEGGGLTLDPLCPIVPEVTQLNNDDHNQ